MAEISYPFAADNSSGGSKNVSQNEWQNMSHLWGNDRIDFQLTESSYSANTMPFFATISGSNIVVQSGSAWVGGFYYRNDGPLSKPAPTNSGTLPRIDLVVLRADLTKGSVNVEIRPGTPSANPSEPSPQRTPGGIWEMPLWAVQLAANNGARTLEDRRRFDGPGMTYVPWNAPTVSRNMPPGNFILDMDSNTNDSQREGFNGRDGFVITRHLGKRKPFTPTLLGSTSQPSAADRKGHWRYIAPGTVQFSLLIENKTTKEIITSSGVTALGFTLPVSTSRTIPSILSGYLSNPESRDGIPNLNDVVCRASPNSQNVYMRIQSPTSLASGLDGLQKIPGKSELIVTGVYETDDFE